MVVNGNVDIDLDIDKNREKTEKLNDCHFLFLFDLLLGLEQFGIDDFVFLWFEFLYPTPPSDFLGFSI